jgi:hypothetical protein
MRDGIIIGTPSTAECLRMGTDMLREDESPSPTVLGREATIPPQGIKNDANFKQPRRFCSVQRECDT